MRQLCSRDRRASAAVTRVKQKCVDSAQNEVVRSTAEDGEKCRRMGNEKANPAGWQQHPAAAQTKEGAPQDHSAASHQHRCNVRDKHRVEQPAVWGYNGDYWCGRLECYPDQTRKHAKPSVRLVRVYESRSNEAKAQLPPLYQRLGQRFLLHARKSNVRDSSAGASPVGRIASSPRVEPQKCTNGPRHAN